MVRKISKKKIMIRILKRMSRTNLLLQLKSLNNKRNKQKNQLTFPNPHLQTGQEWDQLQKNKKYHQESILEVTTPEVTQEAVHILMKNAQPIQKQELNKKTQAKMYQINI